MFKFKGVKTKSSSKKKVSKRKSKGLLMVPQFSKLNLTLFGLFTAAVGGFMLYKALAVTTSVTYSGKLTIASTTRSYTLTTAPGPMSATIKARSKDLTVTIKDKYGTVLGTASNNGNRSATTSFDAAGGAYTATVSYNGTITTEKRFSLTLNYQVADSQVPTAVITAPLSSETVTGSTTIAASATDDTGVAKVEFYVGSTLLATDNAAPYSATWDTTKNANGSATLTAKAYDTSSNIAQATVNVTVNNQTTPPPTCPSGTTGTYPDCVALTCPSGTTGTYPNCTVVTQPPAPTGWTWPATQSNTGPAPGTVFTQMAPREFTTADNGKTFENVEIKVGNGQEFYITGSNITFRNCRIVYTGTLHSPNGFIFIGKAWLRDVRPKNIVFDHCYIDGGNRHEYGITGRYGQFSVTYSQVRGASHVIESSGDLDSGTTINIYRNYLYDYDDTPYGEPPHLGHANVIYFVGNNGLVNIEENTIIGNRYELCANGWSNGPGTGCYEFGGTSAVTVYADEDTNPDKAYVVKHNKISGGGYFAMRFYGQGSGIQSVSVTDNVFTAQAGWPYVTIGGGLYVFDSNIGSKTVSGNSFGSDTTCYSSPSSCASPNL